MDMIQLRYFLKTAQTLNYTRAAECLFISRQSLRQTLGNLEKELGQSLFINDHNRLFLTKYGEYLVHACTKVVSDFDQMAADVTRFFQNNILLRIVIATNLLPFVFWRFEDTQEDFCRRYPHIQLRIEIMPSDQVIDAVEQGEADCGCVLQMPTQRLGCSCTVLRASQVAVTLGEKLPLYEKEVLSLEELATVPLVGMGSLEKIALPLWQDCQRLGIQLNYRVVPNTIEALYLFQNSLAAGLNTFPADPDRSKKVPDPSARRQAHLPGYSWDVAALCPLSRPNHTAAQLFAAFLQQKYSPDSSKK